MWGGLFTDPGWCVHLPPSRVPDVKWTSWHLITGGAGHTLHNSNYSTGEITHSPQYLVTILFRQAVTAYTALR
jgi:hypothetical protein